MESNSNKTKRIAKNTLILYFRMLFLMLVSLYTSRVILDALGVDDYGIYNVVGGFVSMFALVSAALTSACTRFLNFEMGKSSIQRQSVVFSTAVTIQWSLAIIVLVLAEAIGVWYVNSVMVLPADRLTAANWCFQFSVFNFCMNLITVPYNASIIAHEKMKAFAYVSIYQGLANLVISFLVFAEPFDRLVFYAALLLFVQFSVRMMYQTYCRKHFEECKYSFAFDKSLFKQMLSYSVWHLIGNGSNVLKTHGINVLINLFFGPAVNAAKGIANQVDNAVSQFSGNFMMALNPQITQSYAKGDINYMMSLVKKGSRYSFYVIFLLSLPIIINAEYILNIWLKKVPDYAVIFVQLTLISMMISSLSRTLITAQNATGNVRNYQLIVGGVLLLNVPLSYIMLSLGYTVEVVVIVAMVVEVLAFMTRMYMLPKTLKDFSTTDYLKNVVLNCITVAIVAVPIPLIIWYSLSRNFFSVLLSVVICIIVCSSSIILVGCSKSERNTILSKVISITKRLKS